MLAKAAEHGRLETRGDVSKFEGGYRQIIHGINNIIENILRPVEEAVACLKEMACGNFRVAVTGDYAGDHGIMKEATNQTLDSLNELLSEVTVIVDEVASGADKVSDSNNALSAGANRQAVSIQQITASLAEISLQTKQNADHAKAANKIAGETKDNASEGNRQMRNMLRAMNEIQDSSREISKIIKSID
ncbi:MAG: methyl-accepting chemotaxis protein, partial [bacterium]